MADDKIETETAPEIYRMPRAVDSVERTKDIVKVVIYFPGLKKKLFSKTNPANGDLEVQYEKRSFTVTLSLKIDGVEEKYRYNVRKLPDDVNTDACYHKVKKDSVTLYLKKADSRSWDSELKATGIETDQEQVEAEDPAAEGAGEGEQVESAGRDIHTIEEEEGKPEDSPTKEE